MDLTDDIYNAIKGIRGTTSIDVTIGTRASKNAISPSQLKLVKASSNLKYMFDHHLLYNAGLIDMMELRKRVNEDEHNMNSAEFVINVSVGSFVHGLVQPAIKTYLESKYEVDCYLEFDVICRETAVKGSADLLIADHKEKKLYLYDLKTTGPKILEVDTVPAPQYKRQLYAYGKSLLHIFEGYTIDTLGLIYLCKTAQSRLPIIRKVGKPPNVQYDFEVDEDGKTIIVPLPLVKQVNYGYKELEAYCEPEFAKLTDSVIKTLEICKKKVKGFDHWILNEELFNKEVAKITGE